MLPLCTSVTLFFLFVRAYLMARRTRRFVPVGEMGLMPTPESQRICFLPSFSISLFKNSRSFRFRRAGFPLDADVNVLGILAEDEHIHFFRFANRGRHALKIAHGAFAGIKVQKLAQRDVQGAYAAADGRRQRPFDGNTKITDRVDGVIRQPLVEGLKSFLASENFEPGHAASAAISVVHSRIEHPPRRLPDVTSRAISFNEWNNRSVRHLQLASAVADRLAFGGSRLPVIRTLHEYSSLE